MQALRVCALTSLALIVCSLPVSAQSFLQKIHEQYDVDIALAPELIPALDSLRIFNKDASSLDDLLKLLMRDDQLSYKIIDGNKLLLRHEVFSQASGKYTIRGTISSFSDQSRLPFAAVMLEGTNKGTFTDEEGEFTMHLSDTSGFIHIQYLGYSGIVIPVADMIGKNMEIEMRTATIPLDQVLIIVPFLPLSSNSDAVNLKGFRVVSAKDLKNWNAAGMITALTGYTHFSSEHGIRIRSSDAENALILMDKLPVYDPYHFYNLFTPFNSHYFSAVSLHRNHIPVQYGGRIDGLIEVSSEAKNNNASSLLLDTDLLLSSVSGVVSVGDRWSIKAGARISHTAALRDALSNSNSGSRTHYKSENEWSSSQEPEFNFWDINAGINGSIGRQTNVSFSYFRSRDYLDNFIATSLATSAPILGTIIVDQRIDSRDEWENHGGIIGLNTNLGNALSLSAEAFISKFEKEVSYSSLFSENRNGQERSRLNKGFQTSLLTTTGAKAYITDKTARSSGFTIGLDIQHHQIDLLAKENTTPYLLQVQEETEATVFGKYDWLLPSGFELGTGARLTYLAGNENMYLQPVVNLNYIINDKTKIKSSFSKNIQAVRELSVENRFGREVEFLALSSEDAGYPLLRSDKYMLGALHTANQWSLDAEVFYKKMDGLVSVRAPLPDPSFDSTQSPGDFYRLFTGDGWTGGFDITGIYKTEKIQTILSYTLSKTLHEYEKLFNGQAYSPKDDRRHQIKISSQYRFGDFTLSGLLTYKSKAPYVSLARLEGGNGIDMVTQIMVVDYIPPYFSLDLGIDYAFEIIGKPALIGLSVINSTDHVNINDLQHIGRVSREGSPAGSLFLIQETELLGRTLNVHFRYLLN